MNPERKERIVDDVLNRALGPQLVEPRAGFEQRILANLATAPAESPWWRWMWVPVLAAAAVLAIAIGMRVMHREAPKPIEAHVKQQMTDHSQAGAVDTQARSTRLAIHNHRNRRAAEQRVETAVAQHSQELPRQAVFPAPLPLTEQERLLLTLVRQQRSQAQQMAAEQQTQRDNFQKYLDTGEVPTITPTPAQPMR